jgi:hypothetical protein
MGATHFQMRRLPKVASEMALHVLGYNIIRVMALMMNKAGPNKSGLWLHQPRQR